MTKEVELMCGAIALVDDDFWDEASRYNWRRDANGYAVTRGGPRVIYMHRLVTEAKAGQLVDHKNGDVLDNTSENLRFCNHGQNMMNRKIGKNNTSGFPGVYQDKRTGRWRAEIKANGQRRHIGIFDTFDEAVEKRKEAMRTNFGKFCPEYARN